MTNYPKPHQYREAYLKRSAERYANGLQRTGLRHNDILAKAVVERALREAATDYVSQTTDACNQNIQVIMRDHERRMDEIKRSGASLRLKTCPLFMLLFGLLAWYSFGHAGRFGFILSICYAIGSLAFLAMLILGATFDKPGSRRRKPMSRDHLHNQINSIMADGWSAMDALNPECKPHTTGKHICGLCGCALLWSEERGWYCSNCDIID